MSFQRPGWHPVRLSLTTITFVSALVAAASRGLDEPLGWLTVLMVFLGGALTSPAMLSPKPRMGSVWLLIAGTALTVGACLARDEVAAWTPSGGASVLASVAGVALVVVSVFVWTEGLEPPLGQRSYR